MEPRTSHPQARTGLLHRFLLALLMVALGPIAAAAQPFVYVASAGSNSLSVVDAATMAVLGDPVPLGVEPTAVTVAARFKLVLVTGRAQKGQFGRLDLIRIGDHKVDRSVAVGFGPVAVAVDPHRPLAYVLNHENRTVAVFHFGRHGVIHIFCEPCNGDSDGIRRFPDLMAMTPDGARLYLAGTDQVVSHHAFASELNFITFNFTGSPHTALAHSVPLAGVSANGIAVTPDSRFVVITTSDASGGFVSVIDRAIKRRGRRLHPVAQGLGSAFLPHDLAVGANGTIGTFGLVTADRAIVRLSESGTTAAVEPTTGLFPVNFIPDKVAITPSGTLAYITDRTQPLVARFDILKGGAPGAVRVLRLDGTKPEALAVTPDGRFVFVVHGDSTGLKGIVSRIDVGTNQVNSVEVQGRPVALAISTIPACDALTGNCGCPSGLQACGGKCLSRLNLESDPANCGQCGRVCPAGDICTAARCVCPQGREMCNGRCINIAADAANCGGCGKVCPAGDVCTSSRCVCPAGKDICNGRCVSLDADRRNCGRCGIACPTNDVCSSGRCICPTENDVCNGVCVNPDTDTANCGKCGLACKPQETCDSGECVCPEDHHVCSGQCVNLDTSPANCGQCGHNCIPGDTCVSGQCVCPEGRTVCSSRCVNTDTDAAHCGRCGNSCATGETCVNGRCG